MLTLNEERNVAQCLTALAAQTCQDFEVVAIDAASSDRTPGMLEAAATTFPVPMRVHLDGRRLPIGEARNLGVRMAQAPAVAFVSADAEVEPTWVERALERLASCDMVFGRQVHAPHTWTVGAAVRGMRYHFPDRVPDDPFPYASNVAAAYRKELLERFPFDAWTNACEDVLLARRAAEAGFQVAYEPRMVVRHHDVQDARQEWRKCVREGHGTALYRRELGLQWPVLAWGGLLAAAGVAAVLRPAAGLAALAGVTYLPAARRAARLPHGLPRRQVAKAIAASPVFDLAFLANYVRGLAARSPRFPAATQEQGDPGRLLGPEKEPQA